MANSFNPFDHTIYETIQEYGFLHNKGMKRLGQNFLCDENLLDKIARFAIPLNFDTQIIEIGPGPCGLTRSLLKLFPNNKILCIEKDVRFKALHSEILKCYHNVDFVYTDALEYDLNFEKIAVIANLPYNVGTLLLIKWLTKSINNIDKMVLLFQKEVAARICANVGSKQYGSVSVLTQLLCNVKVLFDISNKAFIPTPKVTSSAILLCTKLRYNSDVLCAFSKFIQSCFQFRRKVIGTTLQRLYPTSDIRKILIASNIEKNRRPESITPKEYWLIYNKLMETKLSPF